MALVDVDDSSLEADSQPELVYLVDNRLPLFRTFIR